MLNKKSFITFEEEFNAKNERYNELGIKLKIKGTGSLLLDPNVTNPFVKIHVIDMSTCQPLKKESSFNRRVTSFNESCVKLLKQNNEHILQPRNCDYILPMATTFYDMRIKGQTQCSWNEEFIINENS